MIFVTVGTNPTMAFDRLVRAMDELAGELDEPVVIQRGCANYIPQHAESFAFTKGEHIEELMLNARVIVSHAAAGSIIAALQQNKPLVIVPRRFHLGEHVDDHQLQLAQALAAQRRAVTVYEPSAASLRIAIEEAPRLATSVPQGATLAAYLRRRLDSWRVTPTRRRMWLQKV